MIKRVLRLLCTMYSIIYSVGYMLAVLLSCVSTCDHPFNVPKTVSSPYYFGYKTLFNSALSLDVTLKNIPKRVTNVTVIRYTYQFNYYNGDPNVRNVTVNVNKKTREAEFIILEVLEYAQTMFDVALHNRKGLCHTSQIIDGRYTLYNNGYYWDKTRNKAIYYDNNTKYVSDGYCFSPNVCKMVVDFREVCKGSPVPGNKNEDGSPATVRLYVMIVVVICVAVMSGGLVLLFTKKCHRVKSNTEEPLQKFKMGNPFYVNMLCRQQCQKEIEAADRHYEEIN